MATTYQEGQPPREHDDEMPSPAPAVDTPAAPVEPGEQPIEPETPADPEDEPDPEDVPDEPAAEPKKRKPASRHK